MTKDKVVLVPFPFDDLSSAKLRPAVCLTNPVGLYRHVVIGFITSRIPNEILETDIVLDSKRDDFNITGLRVSSTIRLHRLMTITTSLIQRELGNLSPQMKIEVNNKLCKLFDCKRFNET
jgi:mRNA interferase MazF